MKIAIGSDHAGFELKEKVKKYLTKKGFEIKDFGTYSRDSVDYPLFGFSVAERVAKKEFDFGILVCFTGNGMTIAANKVKGIRAALCLNPEMAKLARQHNDANILSLAAKYSSDNFKEILENWLDSEFEGGRHKRRLDKIKKYEEKTQKP
jgi:ribose 5-phosphate isomerase B